MTKKKSRVKNEIALWTLTAVVLIIAWHFFKDKNASYLKGTMHFYYYFCQFSFIKSSRPDSFCSLAYFSGFFYRNVDGILQPHKKVQPSEFQLRLAL